MSRFTLLGLGLFALALLASPASAQKLLCDPQAGYTMYAHNFDAKQNGMDINGGGNYVYFLANSALFGTPTLGDNVRRCWGAERTRGHQESLGVGPHVSSWGFVILGNAAIVSGLQTIITIDDGDNPLQKSDVCIAPFTVDPFFLTSGLQVGAVNYGLAPGAWGIANFTGVGAGAPIPLVPYFQLNNGLCLKSWVLYELQHGYNATAANQQYLGMVSVDETTYPLAGGIAGDNRCFGADEWFGIVNNGGVVSCTRMVDAPSPPFGGGNFGILLFPGQSGLATCDGLESYLCVGYSEAVSTAGRDNGCLNGLGQQSLQYGAGGANWVDCATTMGAGIATNNIAWRVLDYAYGQCNSPGSVCFNGSFNYWAESIWFCSPPIKCATINNGVGGPTPYDGSQRQLDFPIAPDMWTNAFDNNPKAQANVKWGASFTADVTVPLNFILLFDGCEGANATNPVTIGISQWPRGPLFLLSMCNPKAVNILTTDRTFYIIGLIWCGTRNANGTPGPGSVPLETSTLTCVPIFDC